MLPSLRMPFGWVFKGLAATARVLDLLSQPDRNNRARRCVGDLDTRLPNVPVPATASHAAAGVIFDFRPPQVRARLNTTPASVRAAAKLAKSLPPAVIILIDALVGQHAQTDSAFREFVHRVDQVAQVTIEPVKISRWKACRPREAFASRQ